MDEKEKILDVVEEFAFQNQTDKYLEAFKNWRRREGNPYAFAYTKHLREQTFSESKVNLRESLGSAEQTVLWRLGNLVGFILLVYLLLENVLDKVLVMVLNTLGLSIDMVFWDSTVYGSEELAFLVTGIVTLLKYVVPLLLLRWQLKLPARVSQPCHISRIPELLLAVSLVLLLSTGLGMLCLSRSAEMQKYQRIADSITMGDQKMLLYTVFTVFLVPVLYEFLLHTDMFQSFRQFGDVFAMGMTAALSAFLAHNIPDGIRMCVISLTISYFVLRTGSFITAVILHVVHEICMFSLYYIHNFGGILTPQWWITMLLPCAVGLVAVVYVMRNRSAFQSHSDQAVNFLKRSERTSAFFSNAPMLGLLLACFILTVMDTVM